MSYSFRKKSRVKQVKIQDSPQSLEVYLNNKPLKAYYTKVCPTKVHYLILENLKKGIYNVYIQGGGIGSQFELLEKVLFEQLDPVKMPELLKIYPKINRTDERVLYPKIYGGPKSRARSQKSYR